MPRNPERNYLKAWREHRRMTQAQLAEMVDTTGAVISLLESGDRRLSDKWLRRIAPALGIPVGYLLEQHPDNVQPDILEVWAEIPESSRKQALDVLKAFRNVDDLKDARKEKEARLEDRSSQTRRPRRDTKED